MTSAASAWISPWTTASAASTSRTCSSRQASSAASPRPAHRPGAGVHQPRLHGVGAQSRRAAPAQRRRQPDTERLHRELQWQVPRRMLERAVVRVAGPGTTGDHTLAPRLQRSPPAQRDRTHPAGTVRRFIASTLSRCINRRSRNLPNQGLCYETLVRLKGAGQLGRTQSCLRVSEHDSAEARVRRAKSRMHQPIRHVVRQGSAICHALGVTNAAPKRDAALDVSRPSIEIDSSCTTERPRRLAEPDPLLPFDAAESSLQQLRESGCSTARYHGLDCRGEGRGAL